MSCDSLFCPVTIAMAYKRVYTALILLRCYNDCHYLWDNLLIQKVIKGVLLWEFFAVFKVIFARKSYQNYNFVLFIFLTKKKKRKSKKQILALIIVSKQSE